jgi:hypothetical protein
VSIKSGAMLTSNFGTLSATSYIEDSKYKIRAYPLSYYILALIYSYTTIEVYSAT